MCQGSILQTQFYVQLQSETRMDLESVVQSEGSQKEKPESYISACINMWDLEK